MAKLYFYYASMNAGKSTVLLQTDFNYRERGMATMLYTAGIHDRSGYGIIDSRIGIKASPNPFHAASDLRAEGEARRRSRPPPRLPLDAAPVPGRPQRPQPPGARAQL